MAREEEEEKDKKKEREEEIEEGVWQKKETDKARQATLLLPCICFYLAKHLLADTVYSEGESLPIS